MDISKEMVDALLEAKQREDAFFKRHLISHEGKAGQTANTTPAHRAWVKAVEKEYKLMGKEVRVHLDTPLARKAFILGFNTYAQQANVKGE